MPLPTKRDASRARRRAQLDEQIAVLRVVHARAKKRYAELTIDLLDRTDGVRERLIREKGAVQVRLAGWAERARRLLERDRDA